MVDSSNTGYNSFRTVRHWQFCFILLLLVCFPSANLHSQRLNFGFNFKLPFTTIYNLRINQEGIYPDYSFRTYKVNDNRQLSYRLTNVGLGFMTSLDYARIKLTAGANFNFGSYTYAVDYPISPGNYRQHIADITYWYVDFPLIAGYSFFNSKSFRLYFEAGASYAEDLDLLELNNSDSDIDEFDDDIFRGLFYTDEGYYNIVAGIGLYTTIASFTLRYYERMTGLPENIHVGYFVLNLQINTNFSKLRKHYIYID